MPFVRYKDSVFSLLFSDPDAIKDLYGALESVELDPSIPIKINTLEGALFMERINDVPFEIGGKVVVLVERQSAINPNMAVRALLYITRVYEKIIDGKALYRAKRIWRSGIGVEELIDRLIAERGASLQARNSLWD
jgi:hypothetical protein